MRLDRSTPLSDAKIPTLLSDFVTHVNAVISLRESERGAHRLLDALYREESLSWDAAFFLCVRKIEKKNELKITLNK